MYPCSELYVNVHVHVQTGRCYSHCRREGGGRNDLRQVAPKLWSVGYKRLKGFCSQNPPSGCGVLAVLPLGFYTTTQAYRPVTCGFGGSIAGMFRAALALISESCAVSSNKPLIKVL